MSQNDEEVLLGRIAVHNKLITMDQLVEATLEQGKSGGGKRIGDILLEMGFINPAQLQALLQAQKQAFARRQAAAGAQARPAAPPVAAPPSAATPAVAATPARAAARKVPDAPAARPLPASAPPQPAPAQSRPAARSLKLDALLVRAIEQGASDIHVHTGAPLKIRVHGRLVDVAGAPLSVAEAEALLLPSLTQAEREVLESRGELDYAYTIPGSGRFRANIYRQLRGLDGAFRSVPPQPPSLSDLGLPVALAKLTNFHQGMVLITGPAGCGKSSTLAALLNIVNEERRDHILSIEDPIEVVHPSKRCVVNQRQVNVHTESFARALRAALREDPDVIAIGELRDLETISLAITAAETGHLVLATLHTNNATRTINRLLGVFPPDQQSQVRAMISESLRAVVSQRLVPTADGKGRVPALEVLICNKAVGNLIREDKTYQIRSVLQTGQSQGMCLLDASLETLVKSGAIAREEALRNCEEPKRFAAPGAAQPSAAPKGATAPAAPAGARA
jgi:twitching motility protein PilT